MDIESAGEREISRISLNGEREYLGAVLAFLREAIGRLGLAAADVPDIADDDVLRLQYLNAVEAEVESAQIASDFGKELFAYVVRAMETRP